MARRERHKVRAAHNRIQHMDRRRHKVYGYDFNRLLIARSLHIG